MILHSRIKIILLIFIVTRASLTALQGQAEPSADLSQVIEHARQATVGILDDAAEASQAPRPAQVSVRGSGVHVGDGYIVTARHVVERPERGAAEPTLPSEIRVLTNALEELLAHLSRGSAFLDLVMYRVAEEARSSLPSVARFSDSDAEAGQEVFTVGYPLGWGPAIVFGRVGNPGVFLPTVDTRLLQADLSVCSGNSGGGLFNSTGELVGVMHAIIQTELGKEALANERCSRFAFAVPMPLARRIVEALQHGKPPAFSRLGIRMNAVKQGGRWAIVAGDVSGPALAGGIKKGDLILAIDGTELKDPAHLKNYLMERTAPGQTVTLRVRRAEKELQVPVTLGGS